MNRAERHTAKQNGKTRYFTGVPCVNGHTAERVTANGSCTVCNQASQKQYRNTDKYRAKNNARHKEAGYKRCEKLRMQKPSVRAVRLLTSSRQRAKRINVTHSLTKDWLITKLETGNCELTGLPIDFTLGSGQLPYGPSIDQINPRAGYTSENCRVVLYAVNSVLHNWTLETLLPILRALVEKQDG